MSKSIRIIASVTILEGVAVQSIGFKRYLPIGRAEYVVENLNRFGADEIILSDITNSRMGRNHLDIDLIQKISRYSFTPITYCGGIKSLDDVDRLLLSGVDKVGINSHLFRENLLESISQKYGSQCLIAALDIKNGYLYLENGQKKIDRDMKSIVSELELKGVGEFLINSIDRDGHKCGFDIELYRDVKKMTKLPVILCGGAGNSTHFLEVLSDESERVALVAGNMFSYREHSIPLVKSHLVKSGYRIRTDTFFNYEKEQLSKDGNLVKRSDSFLEDLMYLSAEKEVIWQLDIVKGVFIQIDTL